MADPPPTPPGGPDDDRKEFDWDLHIHVPTIGVRRTLRVTSNESVGAVMIKLATKLGERASDTALGRGWGLQPSSHRALERWSVHSGVHCYLGGEPRRSGGICICAALSVKAATVL